LFHGRLQKQTRSPRDKGRGRMIVEGVALLKAGSDP